MCINMYAHADTPRTPRCARDGEHPNTPTTQAQATDSEVESRRPSRAPCLPCLQLLPWNFAINALLTAHPRMAAVFLRTWLKPLESVDPIADSNRCKQRSSHEKTVGASDFEVLLPRWSARRTGCDRSCNSPCRSVSARPTAGRCR